MPVFLKWDDAERALRARAAATQRCPCPASPPGTCRGWTRTTPRTGRPTTTCATGVVTALLHSPLKRGGALISESAERQLQNLLSMQYSTAALRMLAIEDVLSGPDASAPGPAHQDGPAARPADEIPRRTGPSATCTASPRPAQAAEYNPPTNKIGLPTRLIAGMSHQLRPVRRGPPTAPGGAAPHRLALVRRCPSWTAWWSPCRTAPPRPGTSGTPRRCARLGWRSAMLHWRLRRRWPSWPPSTARRRPGSPHPSRGARRSPGRPVTRPAASEPGGGE